MLNQAPPIDEQGNIRPSPQSSANLRYENLTRESHATSQDSQLEEARPGVPKVEDRQVGEAQLENVAENKPQRTRSRPAGPREPAPGIGRRPTHREAETKVQDSQRQEEDRFQQPIPHPTRQREPASTPTPTAQPRESYDAVADILNTYHFRDSFYERYIPWNIGTNINFRSQNKVSESEVPLVSRFDWTSSESSDDDRGRVFVKEQKREWKKRFGHLKERLKGQGTKIARSIKSAGVIFKGIRGSQSR